MKKFSLSFLIPAYNDARTITQVVGEAHVVGKALKIPFEIFVIDDQSRDKTVAVLRRLQKKIKELRVVVHKKNTNYGGTIKDLYYGARKSWAFTIPGDYQVGAREVLKLIPYMAEADMILGKRVTRNDSLGRQRQSAVYNLLLRIFLKSPVVDANTVRLMKTSIMKHIHLTSKSAFLDAELVIRAARKGYKVIEIPITHRKRALGTGGGGGGKIYTILPTIKEMLAFFFRGK